MAKVVVKDALDNVKNSESDSMVTKGANEPPKKKEIKSWDGRIYVKGPKIRMDMTNGEYANQEHFKKACEAAGIPATARQASQFRMGKGLAFAASKSLTAA